MKKFAILFMMLLFCIPFIYGGCGGGGSGGGGSDDIVFGITGHQLYLIDLDCANSCLDFQCIIDNCVELVANDQLCVGDAIGFELAITNKNMNTTEVFYEIHVQGYGVEGPYSFIIDWLSPEELNSWVMGYYEYALEIPGNHEIHAWLKNRSGQLSSVYVGDVVVNQNCPRAAASLSRSANDPISIGEANSEIPKDEQKSIIQRTKSMGYQSITD
jgi:hypothetical protein